MRPLEYRAPIDPGTVRRFVVRVIIAVVVLIALFQSISIYVEKLWFESVGYASVYWYQLRAQGATFLAFGIGTGILLWLIFQIVIPSGRVARAQLIRFGNEQIAMPAPSSFRKLALPVAAILGLLFGLGFSSYWDTYALFLNRPSAAGVLDPIFHQPLSFYFFTLPVIEALAGWFLTVSIIGMVAAIITALTDASGKFKGVSIGLGILLSAIAVEVYVSRFSLILETHKLITGVGYVEDRVILPGLWFVIAALGVGAVIAFVNAASGKLRNLIGAVVLPVITYVIAGMLIPGYVATFVVKPNEFVKETPYIRNHVEFTRRAYALDQVEEIAFDPRTTGATIDTAGYAPTIENIRMWDWRALQSTLRQLQEIRPYYDFRDVDIDRYTIGGKSRLMMLAARELDRNKLPSGGWISERLVYTHGYGATMNTATDFTKEGLPALIVSNMPVQSTQPEIQLKRPEIYFGEITNWPVYVKTKQKEFNYPEGEKASYTAYEGTGGIRMGSLFRRLLLAWTVDDLLKVPFSDDITADSELLMRRNIRQRTAELAPFLAFDDDPYLVIGSDGGMYWMMDALILSNHYPYSGHKVVGNDFVNYARNSVKAVVNAYDGAVSFYVFEPDDPWIQAYQKMFPALFKPASEMPEMLKSHVRYPEVLFQVQASMYSTYHVTNEQVFFNKDDVWTIAQQSRSQGGQRTTNEIEPIFNVMQFPGEKNAEFVGILPFTPTNKNNMIGWMAARSDGENYGKLRAYQFPKSRFVDGPLNVEARIDQDPQLSSQLTLWNQQGSTVIRGDLLVIPLEKTLLYAEPIYLQAVSSPMPELRLVVLVTQDRLAYGPRFSDALASLIAGQSSVASVSTTTANTESATAPAATPKQLIDRANQSLNDYRKLTSEGKMGEAGAKLDELKRLLEQMGK